MVEANERLNGGQTETSQRMFRFDLVRGSMQGVLEGCWHVFSLLVLIRYFQADDWVKGQVAAAHGYGLILTPFVIAWLGRGKGETTHYMAKLWFAASACLVAAAFIPSIVVFFAAMVLSQILVAQGVPLFTALYNQNYSKTERGKRLSRSVICVSATLIAFGLIGGYVLDYSLGSYRILYFIGAIAALLGAFSIRRMPSVPISSLNSGVLAENLRIAAKDRVFRQLLIGWMMMGMGNLMLIPLRIEVLANPEYGINATNTQIAFLMTFLIPIFRLASTTVWGNVFDRYNLITVRVAINGVFFASIALFFFSGNLVGMGVGCALFGIAMGGGSVMWALWVTKVAPPGKVTLYMSVHGFFTGTRAAVAPFLGYALLSVMSPVFVASLSIILMALSTLVFFPLRRSLIDKDKADEARMLGQSLNRR